MRRSCLLLLGGLLLTTSSMLKAQDEKGKEPKEAAIQEVVQEVSPQLRNQVADLLSKEVDRITAQLEAERQELEELRTRLKAREKKVKRSELALEFLNNRLKQWRPENDGAANNQ
ncbi:MAG: hypothetical protein P8N76_03660 [Pirellulaceae bacterium]|nr:hypothetical protein [Pirellulaceae bacterium]